LLFLLYFFDYADRLVVVSLFPFLKADWGLNDAQCGALQYTFFLLGGIASIAWASSAIAVTQDVVQACEPYRMRCV
jgi:hypothetical protein